MKNIPNRNNRLFAATELILFLAEWKKLLESPAKTAGANL